MLAEEGPDAFYRGSLARTITEYVQRSGGVLSMEDMKQHHSDWVAPISTNYRGYDVWEIPPNGQGMTALIALNILEGYDLKALPRESTAAYHLQLEAIKSAFADAQRYIGDPEHLDGADALWKALLDKDYAAQRRAQIGDQAALHRHGDPLRGGTVYLCAADGDGMMVSMIQSNYMGFGSGIVVPDTGIALHNRGNGFVLQPGHPNQIAPGKRPFHTIIPGFLTRDGQAVGPFGVMGGHMQPQGHLQMIVNTIDYGLNPQVSLDAPRWQWTAGVDVDLELTTPAHVVRGLQERGHAITVAPESGRFGRGQIIWRLPNGAYVAGSESRTDGLAAGY